MNVRSAIDIGILIKDQRKTQGLTQKQLAKKVGVAELWISNFENGKETAQVGLVMKTLAALGLTIEITHSLSPDDHAPQSDTTVVNLDELIDNTISRDEDE